VQAVGVGRSEIGKDFEKPRQPAKIESVPAARILGGGQNAGIYVVGGLERDPVFVPFLALVFLFECGEPLAFKKVD